MMDFKLDPVQFTLLIYYCIINITAAVLTVTDKRRAQKKQWRVPERTLLLLGAAGGALGEFIAMLCIRHKTKHLKFMISMPFSSYCTSSFSIGFFCFEGDFNEHKI